LAFRAGEEGRWLFTDGEAWSYAAELQPWIEELCQQSILTADFIQQSLQNKEATHLLLALINQGSLYIYSEAYPD